ncbi:MAG: dTMP kinase [Rickettsiales bacterium]
MNPRFISFEGGEGAGKSTQLKLLAQSFASAGIAHITTREPGGSPGGEAIRGLVVSGAADKWHPTTESLLFMAARYDHLATKIAPALARGEWVLCDRFYDSTYVYQGIAKGVGTAWLDQLYALLFGNQGPELTLLLDLPPKTGLARTVARGNVAESRFEQMHLDFHETLRQGFLALATANPERIHTIDATKATTQVHAAVIDAINQRFGLALSTSSFPEFA